LGPPVPHFDTPFDLSRPNERGFAYNSHDVVRDHCFPATTSSRRGAAPSPRNACCRRVSRLRRSNIAWSGIPGWNVDRFSRRRASHRTPRAHESGHADDHDRSYPHHGRWPAGAHDRAKIDATTRLSAERRQWGATMHALIAISRRVCSWARSRSAGCESGASLAGRLPTPSRR